LALTDAKRARLIANAITNDYGVDPRRLLTILRDYLATVTVIDSENWSWVATAISALAERNQRIDIDILWAVFEKAVGLPTWRVLELIWTDQGMSCCDRLKRTFADRKEKRGQILALLEKVAPLLGLSIYVSESELRIVGAEIDQRPGL
jgi:hypothetical protein